MVGGGAGWGGGGGLLASTRLSLFPGFVFFQVPEFFIEMSLDGPVVLLVLLWAGERLGGTKTRF